MIGVKYIQAVRRIGYISAISGKNATNVEMIKLIPREKAASKSNDNGKNKNGGRKWTLVTRNTRTSGTKSKQRIYKPRTYG